MRERVGQRKLVVLAVAASIVAVPVLAAPRATALAASPFPAPASANELACDLSPASNPGDAPSWWAAVPQSSTMAGWFWNDIMPGNAATPCRADTAATFWARAVPGNWAPVGNIGGWPWATGGYYTQTLWLLAVPEGWAPVANMGGWPSATGGYYAQWLWLHAVPENAAGIGNVGGWPWATGGYYTQWLWLHAIPDNWAFVDDIGGWPWATGGYYAQWFWLHAVPDDLADAGASPSALGGYYRQWFWLHAVPDNWSGTGNIGGWPWSGGGYYTQWFWLHAVADDWATVAGITGAPWSSGGYYKQWFWLHAVPDNWAGVSDIGGWPWTSGGYFTQWLWLHAVPDSWAARLGLALGHRPAPTAVQGYVQDGQGYFRYWFWEGAVPDAWRPVANIGGWTAATDGWYTQWFWLHAAPDQWARRAAMAVGGTAGAGYYDYTFYHYAVARDFAWRTSLSLGGSQGAGYYDWWFHGSAGQSFPHYRQHMSLAGGYLAGATTVVPASTWFAPDAQAVVAFTFDTEGAEVESCAVSSVLRKHRVAASFYLVGLTADVLTPNWAQCLSGFDIQDHTVDHPGAWDMAPRTFLDTLPSGDQVHEIRDDVARIRARLPGASVTSLRVPWCDSNETLDGSVLQSAVASGMTSDRSVITIPRAAAQAGVVPSLGLAQLSLSAFPSPFTVTTGSGALVEFPFTYPSDWTAQGIHGLNPRDPPPSPGAPGYAVSLWEQEFDEVYAQHGVMVVLMHPWVQAPGGRTPAGLDALIAYMQAKPGVRFTTATTANQSFRRTAGLAQ